jgi:hypothetical protein
MHKETGVAIGVGLGLGLLVTFGYYFVRSQSTSDPTTPTVADQAAEATENAEEASAPTQALELTSPEIGQITQQDQLQVAGQTSPDAVVVVFVNKDETIITADSSGAFSTTVTLENGANFITVTTVSEDGQTTSLDRLVYLEDDLTQPVEEETSGDSDEETQGD